MTLLMRHFKRQSWNPELCLTENSVLQMLWIYALNNMILASTVRVPTFGYQKYMRCFICGWVPVCSFLYGCVIAVKYWYSIYTDTEWCLYGNEFFCIFLMCSFKIHFSTERFQFKVCLLICSFSVSDLSLKKNSLGVKLSDLKVSFSQGSQNDS